MKIIKIESCFNCPLVEIINKENTLLCRCESGANFDHFEEIGEDESIPTWCPLEDE
jgi:hypothetical protein